MILEASNSLNPRQFLHRLAGERRASTVRGRVRAWRRIRVWCLISFNTLWPVTVHHFLDYLGMRVGGGCAASVSHAMLLCFTFMELWVAFRILTLCLPTRSSRLLLIPCRSQWRGTGSPFLLKLHGQALLKFSRWKLRLWMLRFQPITELCVGTAWSEFGHHSKVTIRYIGFHTVWYCVHVA